MCDFGGSGVAVGDVVTDVLPDGCTSTLDVDENLEEKLVSHDGRREGVLGFDVGVSCMGCALPLPLAMECAEDGRWDVGNFVRFWVSRVIGLLRCRPFSMGRGASLAGGAF